MNLHTNVCTVLYQCVQVYTQVPALPPDPRLDVWCMAGV